MSDSSLIPQPSALYSTQWTGAPVCPHCGEEQAPASERDRSTLRCGDCGAVFAVERHVEVTFCTAKLTTTEKGGRLRDEEGTNGSRRDAETQSEQLNFLEETTRI